MCDNAILSILGQSFQLPWWSTPWGDSSMPHAVDRIWKCSLYALARHQGLFPVALKCSSSSISFYLLVLKFLSLILLTFLVPGIKGMLLGPSRAGSWHQHGDFKTPWNVLLAAQHSLGPLGQDLKLSQPLNCLESFSRVEISLAGGEVIWIFIQALAIVSPCSWTDQVEIFAAPVFSYLCSMK